MLTIDPKAENRSQCSQHHPRFNGLATAKLFVKAPFAGEAELAIASDRVLALRSFDLPAGGTTVEIPVEQGWGNGVYALVSAYRASDLNGKLPSGPQQHGPGRAVGVAWLGIDPAPRTLTASLAGPAVVRPPVAVAPGRGGRDASAGCSECGGREVEFVVSGARR
jgi:uncharacterized protein YfaS (alpha-2-macroglobulin family)